MSNSDGFIDEVTEEVRRDQLYATLRKYGWIGVALVLIIVGGTAWSQWSANQKRAAAEARGEALLAALEADAPEARAEALGTADVDGAAGAVAGMLLAQAQLDAGDAEAAAAALRDVAASADTEAIYRDLAALKAAMVDPALTTEERISALDPLARPGQPFRLLAMEQQAIAQIAGDDTDAALATLNAMIEDAEMTGGLRDRVSALIVSLGGALPQSGGDAAAGAE